MYLYEFGVGLEHLKKGAAFMVYFGLGRSFIGLGGLGLYMAVLRFVQGLGSPKPLFNQNEHPFAS